MSKEPKTLTWEDLPELVREHADGVLARFIQDRILEVLDTKFGRNNTGPAEAVYHVHDFDQLRMLFSRAMRCSSVSDFTNRLPR